MTDQSGTPSKRGFTHDEYLEAFKLTINRMAEITVEDIKKELPNGASENTLDRLFAYSCLCELLDGFCTLTEDVRLKKPSVTMDLGEFQEQMLFIHKHYPWFKPKDTASTLKADVAARLESAKRRAADSFAKNFRQIVNSKEITSPIEQIFLLEWKVMGIEDKYHVCLDPQALVESPIGTFQLDFLVRSQIDGSSKLKIGIEIDGHEFHEKTI